MKLTFTSIDIRASILELQKSVVGLRVNQIYDVDHKTYLIKLQKPEQKAVLLLESAARIHSTEYQWPKSPAPSGFSMKLRKHLRNKRLERVQQLGVDRVVQMTFGSGAAQHHLIIELYDRGNIILTDADYTILIILRPRKDGEETRFAAHEVYPINNFRNLRPSPGHEQITEAAKKASPKLNLKKLINPMLDCGGGVVEHELARCGLSSATVADILACEDKLQLLLTAAAHAQRHMEATLEPQGFIIQRTEHRIGLSKQSEEVTLFQEFHPILYEQHSKLPHLQYDTFNRACDEFFQQLESQKLQQRALQKEQEALKKLENVRSDHSARTAALMELQDQDTRRGQLIELNQQLVEAAIHQVRAALAHQLDWRELEEMLQEAQEREEPVACAIKKLSLSNNTMLMVLSDPYAREESDLLLDSDEEREEGQESDMLRPATVEIDLDFSAYANARKYYDSRRKAVTKVQKTMAASEAAIKSATRKTQQMLKEVHTTTSINKLRKVHWFEKFLWFISSENYLVLAGHDQQQNEVLVKRHLKPRDVYVHGDLHGASSVVVKNPAGGAVPPATLHQAGVMALCYSRAWAEKVVTSAWWVWGDQVSKSAPSGEYLTTGSFMVRGKKNFLPPSHLVYGFGFLFRLEESSIARHEGERRVKTEDQADDEVTRRLIEFTVEEDDDKAGLSDDHHSLSDDKVTDKQEALSDHEEIHSDEEHSASDEDAKNNLKNLASDDSLVVEEFPDTVVTMKHVRGTTFAVSASIAESKAPMEDRPCAGEGRGGSRKEKASNKKKQQDSSSGGAPFIGALLQDKQEEGPGPLKRGQKTRLKKIKTKYRDQDDEERELRMELLQSAGAKKEPKRQKGKKGKKAPVPTVKTTEDRRKVTFAPAEDVTQEKTLTETDDTKSIEEAGIKKKEKMENSDSRMENQNDEKKKELQDMEEDALDDDDEPGQVGDDRDILLALTGQPDPEDELLYCVPVCAPYTALAAYKYKVKLTPGPGKKGKACKTAVSLFLSLKPPIRRECDLIRAVRDSDLARNVPGKVKVSAPNISKVRK